MKQGSEVYLPVLGYQNAVASAQGIDELLCREHQNIFLTVESYGAALRCQFHRVAPVLSQSAGEVLWLRNVATLIVAQGLSTLDELHVGLLDDVQLDAVVVGYGSVPRLRLEVVS